MVPSFVGVVKSQIRFHKESHDPFLIAPFKPGSPVVILNRNPFFFIEEIELIESSSLVQSVQDRPEFKVAAYMVRLLLYF